MPCLVLLCFDDVMKLNRNIYIYIYIYVYIYFIVYIYAPIAPGSFVRPSQSTKSTNMSNS